MFPLACQLAASSHVLFYILNLPVHLFPGVCSNVIVQFSSCISNLTVRCTFCYSHCMDSFSFHATDKRKPTQSRGHCVFTLKNPSIASLYSLARHCNLFLSLQCCVGSRICFLTACNTLFHCMPQNQNYRLALLRTWLDTICCHEYLIRCRRDCSKYSLSSLFHILLAENQHMETNLTFARFLNGFCDRELFCSRKMIFFFFLLILTEHFYKEGKELV